MLEQRGVCVLSARAVDDPSALQATLRTELAGHRCRLVVIGGGDGTISEVVDCLAEHYRVLGLLPLGTSNNFARTLGIPIGIEAAVDIIATGKIADVDLGRVDGDYFANVVSAGLTVAMNLDGGSSSALVAGGPLRNSPRDDEGKPLPEGGPTTTAIVFESNPRSHI